MRLTPRQEQVLIAIANGMKQSAIARELGISEGTVDQHVTKLYRAIKCHGIALATRWAIKHRLVKV